MNAVIWLALFGAVPADFDTQVLPVLARAGCNAGACHGAAAGRGGFKLSLFGGDPAADYRAIVHDLEGRRVNLARPDRSLLLLKPTWEIDHEGGQRFEADSAFAKLLTEWIKAGAPRRAETAGASPQLVGLAAEPRQMTVSAVPAEVELRITAQFADGSSRRVEDMSVVTPADLASTELTGAATIRVLRPGRHAVVVRFLTHVEAVQITAPHANPPLDAAALPRTNWIDDEINATLAALRLPPSPRADDAALLRRVTLDLTGRLPTADRVREYLADKSEGKFAAEVDRLLNSPAFAEYWTYKFARWLRIQVGPNDARGAKTFHAWLRLQIESGRPLDQWTAEMIAADGNSHEEGPPNFHRTAGDARSQAEYLTESLLGIRLRCANCHNHPLDRWTQDDYHGLAAIFARVERGPNVSLRSTGEVVHPATGIAAVPRIPGERFLPADGDNRPDLAQWLTSSDRRLFAKGQVNRLWQSLFGRGLIEPIDDLRDTNPASHPELLNRLTSELVERDYDLKHMLRLMVSSAAYQRSGKPLPAARGDDRFCSHAQPRPLAPEVLLDAMSDALAVPLELDEKAGRFFQIESSDWQPGTRAIAFFTPQIAGGLLGPLAPCPDRGPCAAQGDTPRLDDLAVQLHWINGPLLNARVADSRSELARLARSSLSTRNLLDDYYLRALSRLPTETEVKFWLPKLRGTSREKKCEDLAWALLSCREFVTNH